MAKIRLGIIGYGAWVRKAYIPGLQQDKRAEIVGISAKSDATINLIRNDFENSVDVYKDYEDLLATAKIDGVMIAVPDSLHVRAIISALNSGKAVFYEPPIAHTRELVPDVIKKLLAASQIT
ncbi:MAG TPA: Gfo/Idh/MocA family oxidoreductase, partial [Puia sp.]|nr:Gfo/Idh/MocA family oxidoreductase [Puia sp.]